MPREYSAPEIFGGLEAIQTRAREYLKRELQKTDRTYGWISEELFRGKIPASGIEDLFEGRANFSEHTLLRLLASFGVSIEDVCPWPEQGLTQEQIAYFEKERVGRKNGPLGTSLHEDDVLRLYVKFRAIEELNNLPNKQAA